MVLRSLVHELPFGASRAQGIAASTHLDTIINIDERHEVFRREPVACPFSTLIIVSEATKPPCTECGVEANPVSLLISCHRSLRRDD